MIVCATEPLLAVAALWRLSGQSRDQKKMADSGALFPSLTGIAENPARLFVYEVPHRRHRVSSRRLQHRMRRCRWERQGESRRLLGCGQRGCRIEGKHPLKKVIRHRQRCSNPRRLRPRALPLVGTFQHVVNGAMLRFPRADPIITTCRLSHRRTPQMSSRMITTASADYQRL
jgi:hypothetical protein